MTSIVLCYPVEQRHLDWIQAASPRGTEVINAGQEGIAEALLDADIFCGHAKVPVPWEAAVSQGRLRWIQSSAAGLDHCLTPPVIASEIRVTSSSGLFANQVAEQTLALLYGLFRRLPKFFRLGLERRFERFPTWDLHGKTIGIVGLGGNGLRIAELLAPLGNPILAVDRFPITPPPCVDELVGVDQLNDVLSRSDVVILGVPLNAQTYHLFDADRIAHMKPGAVLINVARGPVVCERALIEALDSGHLMGAGLDVTEVEPLSEDSPLWNMDNVLITPHVGAQSATRVDDSTKLFCLNLLRWFRDEPLGNEVDKPLGFPHPAARISLKEVRAQWDREFGKS